MSNFISRIFESRSGVSSKRIFGGLGFFITIVISIYCTIAEKQAPMIVESILYSSLTLLGIDSVTGIWSNKNHCKNENNGRTNKTDISV